MRRPARRTVQAVAQPMNPVTCGSSWTPGTVSSRPNRSVRWSALSSLDRLTSDFPVADVETAFHGVLSRSCTGWRRLACVCENVQQ
jgi:hypothetical protein